MPNEETPQDPLVLVREEVFQGGLVTDVFHEWEGDWQYLMSDGYERDKTPLVHQSHVFAADPSLRETAEMPPGVWAHRQTTEGGWHYEVLSDDDDG